MLSGLSFRPSCGLVDTPDLLLASEASPDFAESGIARGWWHAKHSVRQVQQLCKQFVQIQSSRFVTSRRDASLGLSGHHVISVETCLYVQRVSSRKDRWSSVHAGALAILGFGAARGACVAGHGRVTLGS